MLFTLSASNKNQDGQNENNDGNGAPDGKEAPDGKGGPDDNGGEGSANVTIKKRDGTVIKKGSNCYTITVLPEAYNVIWQI